MLGILYSSRRAIGRCFPVGVACAPPAHAATPPTVAAVRRNRCRLDIFLAIVPPFLLMTSICTHIFGPLLAAHGKAIGAR